MLAEAGAAVEKGDPLLEVVFEEEAEPPAQPEDGAEDEADGTEEGAADPPPAPKKRYRTVEAPAAGTVSAFGVLPGQDVAVGDDVATITSGGFSVTGTLSPEQQYRLLNAPTTATVAAQGGPAPFDCGGLSIGRAADGGQQSDEQGGQEPAAPQGGGSTQVRCTVPAGVQVFDGLAATMSITAGEAPDVLVVPVTAVEGSFGTGNVWVTKPDADPEKRPVTLGLTDGELVEVKEGLTEGESILEFVPGSDVESELDGMVEDSTGEPVPGGVVEGAAGS